MSPQRMNQDEACSLDSNDDVVNESMSPGTAIPRSETERPPKWGVQFQDPPDGKKKRSSASPL